MTQLTAEAETKEQTARRLEEELRSERCGEESGLFMIEEISESKLRRAIGTLRGAKAQADARRSELEGVVTADIDDEEERSACRDARKALNRDVERVRERIQGLHVELNKVS